MTERERELLRFIEQYTADHDGVAPTFEEMAAGIGMASKPGIHRLCVRLASNGHLRREGTARGYVPAVRVFDLASVSDGDLLSEVARRGLVRAAA